MVSVGEIAERVLRAGSSLPDETVIYAGEVLDEAATVFFRATEGSCDAAAAAVVDLLRTAREGLDDVVRLSIEIRQRTTTLVDRLAGSSVASPLSPAVDICPTAPRAGTTRIEDVRRRMPEGQRNTPAQGRWLDGENLVEMSSGRRDDWHAAARNFVRATFPPAERAAERLASHVEVKLAVRMRRENRTNETVIIDRKVCGRRDWDANDPFTCDKYLERFLPPGATMTVVQRDGTTVTYRGKTTS